MCDPMSIGAIALSAAGSLAQNQAQSAARRAIEEGQNAAQAAETERQNRYEREARTVWETSRDNATRETQDAKLGDAVEKRKTLYSAEAKATNPSSDLLSGQSNAPDSVKNFIVGKMDSAATRGQAEGAAKANLDAWGDLQQGNAIGNQRAGEKIGMFSGFGKASAGILPLELEAARRAGASKANSPFGDLLTAAGMLTGFAGAAGYGPQTWGGLFGGGSTLNGATAGTNFDVLSSMGGGSGMKQGTALRYAI